MSCRVCLDEGKTFLSLQTEVEFEGKYLTCMEMYCSITGIEDVNENNISTKVCLYCFTELNKCFKFQKKAIQSFYNLLSRRDVHTPDPAKLDEDVIDNVDMNIEKNIPQQLVRKTEIEIVDNESRLNMNETSNVYDEEFLEAEFVNYDTVTRDTESQETEITHAKNTEQHKCTICCKLLPSQAELDTHFVADHSEYVSGHFVCSVCNKRFGSKKTIRQHCRIHQDHDSRRFRCSYCSKAFNYSHHLKIHETTHTMEKPFSCVSCDKRFACKDRLKNHEVQHTDIFRHRCESCSCSFRSKKTLKMHTILKHDAAVEKFDPIRCNKCNKKLYSQSAASVHLKGPCGNSCLKKRNRNILDEQ
ncbi:zinc finger protein 845-like [Wyeomyia smithii]|uniref:zinc finger protein 845-like n=1 Tax=Wyeomyia smithii TaxID=174621 RepID=UPI002467B187|nr:zinc finger protein 845-like [Wyeomyia smithii]